jgi:hypothetical protein
VKTHKILAQKQKKFKNNKFVFPFKSGAFFFGNLRRAFASCREPLTLTFFTGVTLKFSENSIFYMEVIVYTIRKHGWKNLHMEDNICLF